MRISRLYLPQSLETGQTLALDNESAHYVRTVLRLKKDAALIVFDGRGGEYAATVIEASRKNVRIAIEQWYDRNVESPLTIDLGLAVSRADRMDWAVQKSVELGVNVLTPLLTERCLVRFKDEDKQQQRLLHWQKIVQHAAEQCGRTVVPKLEPVTGLQYWLTGRQGLKIFLDPYAEHSLSELSPFSMNITLFSGPEGGFADHERDLAIASGFIPVKLGARILRTETAALTALAAAQMLWGDFAKPS